MKKKIQNEQPRYLTLAEDLDHPADWWRVEFRQDGAGYTIFAGQQAEARARDFHDAIAEGRLETRIAEAQRGGSISVRPKQSGRKHGLL
jgi:hypothetical protein